MRRACVVAVVAVLVVSALVIAFSQGVGAEGRETGVFPDRTFEITRSPPGGPKSDTYTTAIDPTVSGHWSVRVESLAGSWMVVQVYRLDGGVPTLEGSSKIRDLGTSTVPMALFGGQHYSAHFTPYGKGGTSVLTEHFVANIPPIACFTYAPAAPTVGDTITFDGRCSTDSDGQIVAYDWDFGDGSTASGSMASHAYAADGTYSVSLRVTDDLHAYDTHQESVPVSPPVNKPPVAAFTYSPASPKVLDVITFDGQASYDPDGTIASFAWDFGDGGTGVDAVATHAYASAGTYAVTLTVTDNLGLPGSLTKSVVVLPNEPPIAAFSWTPTTPKAGIDNVLFDGGASSDPDGTIASWSWDFGDGSSASGSTAYHMFAAAGTYTVTLTVTDNEGAQGSVSHDVTVVANQPPVASFTWSPASPKEGVLVTFDASASYDPDGFIVSYVWDFGDGTSGTDVKPTHAFAAGDYMVTLVVTDNNGAPGTASHLVSVAANAPPIACFSFSDVGVVAGVPITFDAACSSDPDGTLASYAWDFGDGSTGSGSPISHAFALAGDYTVTLTVTDDGGASASSSQVAHIQENQLPVAVISYSPLTPMSLELVTFDGSGSYDPAPPDHVVSYAWSFADDGSTASGSVATHTFAKPGTWRVTLTVTDTFNAAGSAFVDVVVGNRPPVAQLTVTPTSGSMITSFFADGSTSSDPDGTIASYHIEWGDGFDAWTATASHTYILPGDYTVTLTVTDDKGASASATVPVSVVNLAPVAILLVTPATAYTNDVISADATLSYDQDGAALTYLIDWGDGTSSSTGTATHQYAVPGVYSVRLTVTDPFGAWATTAVPVTILNRPPVLVFTLAPTSVLTFDLVTADLSGSYDPDGTIASYSIAWGDGSLSTTATASHAYSNNGIYTVSVSVTDDRGASASDSATVTVADRPPVAAFTFSPASPNVNTLVLFDGSGSSDPDGVISSYAWAFGDGSAGSGSSASHAYAAPGTFTATLTVTDDDGQTASVSHDVVVVNLAPVASLSVTPLTAQTLVPISADGSASHDPDGTIATYLIDWGDGATSTTASASHPYATAGTYTITLTVTDAFGATGTATQAVLIQNRAPTASLSVTPSTVLSLDTVTADGSASSDADGYIASYLIDWGDGSSATTSVATHAYATAGAYTVVLTVTDNLGATASASSTVTVNNRPPTAAFDFSPASPNVGDTVNFDGSTSSDLDGTIASYAWDFGDGSTGTGVTTSHIYNAGGTFTVVLTVTDNLGAIGTLSKDVVVKAPAGCTGAECWTFYDFFSVPYGEWWDIRGMYGLTGDVPIGADCFSQAGIDNYWCIPSSALPDVASYPYTNWVKTPVGDAMIVAPYRFTADIRQNPAMTMDQPIMLPRCEDLKAAVAPFGVTVVCPATPPSGGSFTLDESISYLTTARATELAVAGCPDMTFLNDGFITELKATITMDQAAVAKLFGVTDPSAWVLGSGATSLFKAGCGTGIAPTDTYSGVLEQGLKAWFEAQGNGPYDIFSTFNAAFSVFSVEGVPSYDAGTGTYTLVLDMTAWGFETLFARWAYWGAATYAAGLAGTAPSGWWGMEMPWTEDLSFHADVGAAGFDAQVGGVIQYHFRASASAGTDGVWYTADDVPEWVWQPVLGDRLPYVAASGHLSELKDYSGLTYIHTTPGSGALRYGMAYAYDYVPAVWALKAGETQKFVFPTQPVVLFSPYLTPRGGGPRSLVSITSNIILGSSVPASGVGTYDLASNTLSVVGPIVVGTYPTTPTGKPLESRPIYILVKP